MGKCSYCDGWKPDHAERCPGCGRDEAQALTDSRRAATPPVQPPPTGDLDDMNWAEFGVFVGVAMVAALVIVATTGMDSELAFVTGMLLVGLPVAWLVHRLRDLEWWG